MVLSPDPLVGSAKRLGLLLALSGHGATTDLSPQKCSKADIDRQPSQAFAAL